MVNHLPKEDGQQQQGFDPKAPHFFKIILEDTIQSGKLVIPKRFIRMYGEDLSNVVLLKVPSGDVWKVELQRCNDTVCLDKGWKDFVSFYSLELGHLLVFRYELGSSDQFQVVIFDKTTTEIKYPMAGKSDRPILPSMKIELSSDDDSDVIGKDISSDQLQPRTKTSRHELPSLVSPQPQKKLKTIHPNNASCSNSENTLPRVNRIGKKIKHQPMCSLGAAERAEALLRAKSFRSNNPYFILVMQPSYVYSTYILCLPGEFMLTHVLEKNGVAKLCISNGRTWRVRYNIGVYGNNVQARMFHGWKAFAEENSLVVGDVCAFELIRDAREVSFKVTIFKAPQATNSCCSPDEPGSIEESTKIPCNQDGAGNHRKKLAGRNYPGVHQQPSSGFVSNYPFFQVMMRRSYLSHNLLNVPLSFVKKHFKSELREQIITLKVSGRSWPVKLWSYPESQKANMSGGLSAFIKENSLKIGDLCTFELINKNQMVLRVSILRDTSISTVKEEQ